MAPPTRPPQSCALSGTLLVRSLSHSVAPTYTKPVRRAMVETFLIQRARGRLFQESPSSRGRHGPVACLPRDIQHIAPFGTVSTQVPRYLGKQVHRHLGRYLLAAGKMRRNRLSTHKSFGQGEPHFYATCTAQPRLLALRRGSSVPAYDCTYICSFLGTWVCSEALQSTSALTFPDPPSGKP